MQEIQIRNIEECKRLILSIRDASLVIDEPSIDLHFCISSGIKDIDIALLFTALSSQPAIAAKINKLDLAFLNLTVLPEFKNVNFVALEELWLQRNRLEHLPDLSSLSKLKKIILCSNNFTIPPNFQGLNALEELRLGGNPLIMPPNIKRLPALMLIDIGQFGDEPGFDFRDTLTVAGKIALNILQTNTNVRVKYLNEMYVAYENKIPQGTILRPQDLDAHFARLFTPPSPEQYAAYIIDAMRLALWELDDDSKTVVNAYLSPISAIRRQAAIEFEIFASAFSLVPEDEKYQPMVVLQEYKFLFEQRLQKLDVKYRNILFKIENNKTVTAKAQAIKNSRLSIGA